MASSQDGFADTVGVVTTHDFGQGVYVQGPGTFVGTTGYLWSPVETGITRRRIVW